VLVTAFAAGCGGDPTDTPAFVAPASTPPRPVVTLTPLDQPSATKPAATPPPKTAAPPRPPAPKNMRRVFPVRASKVSIGKTHSGYPASDIFADCGAPVAAVADGVVLEVNRVDRYDPATDVDADRGGKSVSVLGDDGVRYYGSHFVSITDGIEAGVRVKSGQSLGKVGHTGRASGVCHLHFGLSPPCARTADWWIRRGVVWPQKFLNAWRDGRQSSPVQTVTAWHKANGCPKAP
jgi:murein DD-endopeptidase MepM/ murein hydrolase activator NlpD